MRKVVIIGLITKVGKISGNQEFTDFCEGEEIEGELKFNGNEEL